MKWFHRRDPYSLYVTHSAMDLEWCFMFLSDWTPALAGWVISVKCLSYLSLAHQHTGVVGSGGYSVHSCYSLRCQYRSEKDWLACEEMEIVFLFSFSTCNINAASLVVSTMIYLEQRWFWIAKAKEKTAERQTGGWDAGKQLDSSSDILCPVTCLCWLCSCILVLKMPDGQFI